MSYFAIGIFHCKTEANIGTLWRSAAIFGAQYVFTIGRRYRHQRSDTLKAWRHIPLFHYETLEEMSIPHDCKVIGVEIAAKTVSLPSFAHPKRAIYLLGAEDHGLSDEAMGRCNALVKVPTAAEFCLNVSTVGSIVMYDRFSKNG